MYYKVNCGCEQRSHCVPSHVAHDWGCCCGHKHALRHFSTKQEIKEKLMEHLQQLKTGAKGVDEKLADLETES